MATTLSTQFHQGNYCSTPTIDVEIVQDQTLHCDKCEGVLMHTGERWPAQEIGHERAELDQDHRPSVKPRCHYCRAEGTLTHRTHPWHDSADCSRCGGSYGFALGD